MMPILKILFIIVMVVITTATISLLVSIIFDHRKRKEVIRQTKGHDKPFKGYKKFRNEILKWAKTRYLDTVKVLYHPDDESFMKAFEIEWNKDPECKDFSLEIFTHKSFKEKNLVQKGTPILTGKNSKAVAEFVYGNFFPDICF